MAIGILRRAAAQLLLAEVRQVPQGVCVCTASARVTAGFGATTSQPSLEIHGRPQQQHRAEAIGEPSGRRWLTTGSRVHSPAEAKPNAVAGTGTSPEAASTSALPTWLRSLLPGGRYLDARPLQPQQQPGSSSGPEDTLQPGALAADGAPATAAAPSASAESDRRKEYVEYLEQHKDLTLEGFVELNKQLWLGSQPPRPKVLPLPRSHPDSKRFIDWKRVSYLRTIQHEKIASMMSSEERETVRARGRDVLKDNAFLRTIAHRTGVYMEDEVKDCIHSFFETRDHMRRLYRWVVVLGEPEPLSNEAQAAALKEMKELEADETRMEALERQDRALCPILPVLDFVGHDAKCSRTGLRFHECCGGAQGRPAALVAIDRARDLKGLRGRKVPRSERELRKHLRDRTEAHKWSKP